MTEQRDQPMAPQPYQPRALLPKAQDQVNTYYQRQGITQALVREPLPLGGYGFIWKFYRHGIEIPNGIQGI